MTISSNLHRFLRGPEAQEAQRIIEQLRSAGFVAYLAGGCVRDALLGKRPKDYDVATDATPDAIREVFGKSRTLAFGASFGVIGVLPPRGPNQPRRADPTEVATFRSDGDYSDGRRPDSVHFGDARHDALRRDFTINGLFYDPIDDAVIDFVDGQQDLEAKILRTIGDPVARFGEDKLRMLRAVRFASTLGFEMDAATHAATVRHAADITIVSHERVGAEMRRILAHRRAAEGLHHLSHCGLADFVLPELKDANVETFAAQMSTINEPYHFPTALALLLNSLSDQSGSLTAIAARWRLSNDEVRQVNAAVRNWRLIAEADQLPWARVQPVLIDRDVQTVFGGCESNRGGK